MISFLFHTSSGDFLNGSYCSFEDGDCSWKPIAGRTLSWKRLQSPAKTSRQSCPSSGGERASLVISGAYKTLAYLQTLLSANASLEPPEGKFYMKATTYIFGDFNDLEYLILTAVATYPNLWCHRHWFCAALWYKQNPAESKRCSVSTLCILLQPQFILSPKTRVCFILLKVDLLPYKLKLSGLVPNPKFQGLKFYVSKMRKLSEPKNINWFVYVLTPAYLLGSLSAHLCLYFIGVSFSVEGGHAKGQRSPAVLRSPLFPPPLRNSPCTVRNAQRAPSAPPSLFTSMHKRRKWSLQFSLPGLLLGCSHRNGAFLRHVYYPGRFI